MIKVIAFLTLRKELKAMMKSNGSTLMMPKWRSPKSLLLAKATCTSSKGFIKVKKAAKKK